MATAPPNMYSMAVKAAKALGGQFSGIVGDAAHGYGYHLAPNQLPSSDYSVRLSLDTGSGVNRNYASALDISLPASTMKQVTARLKAAALDPNDTAMEYVREFYGTLNGSSVYGLIHDSATGAWRQSTSDSSHLWHVHVSIFRKYANDKKALDAVYGVLVGTLPETGDDVSAKDLWHEYMIDKIDPNSGTSSRMRAESYLAWIHQYTKDIKAAQSAAAADRAALLEAIRSLASGIGVDPEAIISAAEEGAKRALSSMTITMESAE